MKISSLQLALLVLASSGFAGEIKLAEAQDQLVFLNSGEWTTATVQGKQALVLDVPGKQRPPVRRPSEFALVKDATAVSEFTLVATTLMPDDVNNRDVCLIFGYQDDTHFYYAHISSNSDNKFHNIIMRVDGNSRTRINVESNPEARLSKDWKTIKIRHMEDGTIQVFVDDMESPNMTAKDTTYPVGRIGFGSFDDRAAFAALPWE
jgi:hypothetical protein